MMETFQLKNGEEVFIREALPNDAQQIIDFYNLVGGETDFLSFGKDEFTTDVAAFQTTIQKTQQLQGSIMYLAIANDEIISIATIDSPLKKRVQHVGTLGIVIRETHTGLGLGKKMMNELIEWARTNGVTEKITLLTREDNETAIQLYKKLGFETEGILKKTPLSTVPTTTPCRWLYSFKRTKKMVPVPQTIANCLGDRYQHNYEYSNK